ncbi:Membrane protein (fragment) [Vibrio diabolicus]
MDWFNLGSLVVILWIVLAYCLPDWKKVVWPKLEKEKAFQHLVFATLFFF